MTHKTPFYIKKWFESGTIRWTDDIESLAEAVKQVDDLVTVEGNLAAAEIFAWTRGPGKPTVKVGEKIKGLPLHLNPGWSV